MLQHSGAPPLKLVFLQLWVPVGVHSYQSVPRQQVNVVVIGVARREPAWRVEDGAVLEKKLV